MEEKTHFEFPCTFPIKVMGDKSFDLMALVQKTLEQHVKDPSTIHIHMRESAGGKYISVTGTFMADSKDQLNAIYQILSKHEHVKMVL
jgi:putative lipoic acid-binding regulatory protein